MLTSLKVYSLLLGKGELTASIQTVPSFAPPSDWQWLTIKTSGLNDLQGDLRAVRDPRDPNLSFCNATKKRRQFLVVCSALFRQRMLHEWKMLYKCYFYLRLESHCDVNHSPRLRPPQGLDFPSSSSGLFIFPPEHGKQHQTGLQFQEKHPFIIWSLFLLAS